MLNDDVDGNSSAMPFEAIFYGIRCYLLSFVAPRAFVDANLYIKGMDIAENYSEF